MKFKVIARHHRPNRVALMTSLPMNAQRNWATRGLLEEGNGPRGRLDTYQAAKLAVRAWAAFLGYPPSESEGLGQRAGPILLYTALLDSLSTMHLTGDRSKRSAFIQMHNEGDEIARTVSCLKDGSPIPTVYFFDRGEPDLMTQTEAEASDANSIAIRKINLIELGQRFSAGAEQPLFDVELEP